MLPKMNINEGLDITSNKLQLNSGPKADPKSMAVATAAYCFDPRRPACPSMDIIRAVSQIKNKIIIISITDRDDIKAALTNDNAARTKKTISPRQRSILSSRAPKNGDPKLLIK